MLRNRKCHVCGVVTHHGNWAKRTVKGAEKTVWLCDKHSGHGRTRRGKRNAG